MCRRARCVPPASQSAAPLPRAMAAARARASASRAPPLEPCGCLVLLEFDDPRRAWLDERALYAALLDLGVRPRRVPAAATRCMDALARDACDACATFAARADATWALLPRRRCSNGEVFAPQDGALACAWFFCPTATGAHAAGDAAGLPGSETGACVRPTHASLLRLYLAAADSAAASLRLALLQERVPMLRGAKARSSHLGSTWTLLPVVVHSLPPLPAPGFGA